MALSPIAFDVDGVLVDTDELHYVALNDALMECVAPTACISRAEHASTFKGLPTRVKLARLLEEGRITPAQVPLVAERKRVHTTSALDHLRCDPQKRALMRALRARGFRMGAVSNAIRTSAFRMVQIADVDWAMDFVLSAEDAAPKPAPDLYLLAAKRFEVPPTRMLVVEDGQPGMLAASRAGAHVIAVTGPADVTVAALLPRIEEESRQCNT